MMAPTTALIMYFDVGPSQCKPFSAGNIGYTIPSLPKDDTTLYVAAKLGYVDQVERELSKASLDPTQRARKPIPNREQSALHVAAERGFSEIVEMLLESGLAVDFRDVCGRTPLHLAALYHRVDTADILLDFGADPNARDHWEETPLSLARAQDWLKVIEILLDNGARPKPYERYRLKAFAKIIHSSEMRVSGPVEAKLMKTNTG